MKQPESTLLYKTIIWSCAVAYVWLLWATY